MKRTLVALACFATACSTPSSVAPPETAPPPKISIAPKPSDALEDPSDPTFSKKAPEEFKARFETSKGTFVIQVTRASAPIGADRFYNLVRNGFYDDCRFFRVLTGFMAQFGINGDPEISLAWRNERIEDDPVRASNTRGMVTFATGGPNTRTTQLFINYGNNSRLDGMGFSPFGKVIEGMGVVDELYSQYGEGAPGGRGPDQGLIQAEGNAYLKANFAWLDFIKRATIED